MLRAAGAGDDRRLCLEKARTEAGGVVGSLFAIASGFYASRNLPTSSILLTLIIAPYLSRHSEERSDAEPQAEQKIGRLQSF